MAWCSGGPAKYFLLVVLTAALALMFVKWQTLRSSRRISTDAVDVAVDGSGTALHLFDYLDSEATQSTVPYRVVSRSPRAYVIEDLLNASECEALIALGAPHLIPSGVWEEGGATPNGSRKKKAKGKRALLSKDSSRTSTGTRLPAAHPIVKAIDRRLLHDVFRRQFKGTYAERIQLLRYSQGQHYNGHLDTFGGIKGKLYQSTLRGRQRAGSKPWKVGDYVTLDRAVTILLYLQAPEAGGNTSLPYAPVNGAPTRFRSGKDDPCDQTRFLQVPPKAGSALIFYSLTPGGVEDSTALHMGCPVLSGVKYVATKWLMVPLPPPPSLLAPQKASGVQ